MKSTLILGASLNTGRYSNMAIKKLKEKNIVTFAVGIKKGTVLGVEIETEKRLFKNIHTVSLYINPTIQKEYYKYVIDLQPKRVIFNPGTENLEFVTLLTENNIESEIACTLVLLSTNQY